MSNDKRAPEPAAVRLLSITFPAMPGGLGHLGPVDSANPPARLTGGWSVSIRGGAVFLVSPKGWIIGKTIHEWDRDGARTIFEVARPACALTWSADDQGAIDKLTRHDQVLERPAPARDEAA